MITSYRLDYNENPQRVATRVVETGTLNVCNAHQRPHDELVYEHCVFYVNGQKYSYDEFVTAYYKK